MEHSDQRLMRVSALQDCGVLLVEDGNHGEYRPRPDEFEAAGVAFIRAADIDGSRVRFAEAEKINSTAMQRIRKGIGAPGDVLLSHKGTVGKLALVPKDAPRFVCSPQTTFWRVLDSNQLDRRYLFYYMRSEHFRRQLNARKGETDMADYVSLTAQRTLQVILPPASIQRAIAHILGTLDDKIELNRRMNETLEGMARAIFKSCFVDFDPVRAKADGRQPAGLDAATAALFPDSFEDSPLGKIPKGWFCKPLDSIAEFLNGLALQKFPPAGEQDLPVVKIAQLRLGATAGCDFANNSVPGAYVIEDGDLLFSWSGSLEVRIWAGGRGALNQHLFKVSSTDLPQWFVYQWLLEHLPDFR